VTTPIRRLLNYGSDVELKAYPVSSKRIYFLDPDGNRLECFYPMWISPLRWISCERGERDLIRTISSLLLLLT
jgi:hypothetical protein